MRSRCSGPGWPSDNTKVSGRRVTSKAPLAHLAGGSGRSEASPTAILQDTHSLEGAFCEVCSARHPLNTAYRRCRRRRKLSPWKAGQGREKEDKDRADLRRYTRGSERDVAGRVVGGLGGG